MAKITDDNKDGVLEVNRPQEIDALLAATNAYLSATSFPMEGRRLVWVSDSRVYYSAGESRELAREEYEATAYASVYKFSHDVSPARAALGAGGCIECHSTGSPFFQGAVLDAAFTGNDARPRWIPNHLILGVSPFWVRLGAVREEWLKPLVYGLGTVAILLLASLGIGRLLRMRLRLSSRLTNLATAFISLFGILALASLTKTPDWLSYIIVRRFTLDANHPLISLLAFALAAGITFIPTNSGGRFNPVLRMSNGLTWTGLALASLSGAFMFIKIGALPTITRFSYTGLELGLAIALFAGVMALALRVINGFSSSNFKGTTDGVLSEPCAKTPPYPTKPRG